MLAMNNTESINRKLDEAKPSLHAPRVKIAQTNSRVVDADHGGCVFEEFPGT